MPQKDRSEAQSVPLVLTTLLTRIGGRLLPNRKYGRTIAGNAATRPSRRREKYLQHTSRAETTCQTIYIKLMEPTSIAYSARRLFLYAHTP